VRRASVPQDFIEVQSTPETVRWGRLPSAGASPIALVADGATVVVNTVSHEGILEDQGRDPVTFFGQFGVAPESVLIDACTIAASSLVHDQLKDGPHIVLGPIAVSGARPGDLLKVETLALERRTDYGIVSNRHGRGVLAGELPRDDAEGHRVPVVSTFGRVIREGRGELIEGANRIGFRLREFLGLVGVTPALEEELSSTPPGPHGGNLDVRHLGVSSTLYLPVAVDEALFYVGDPHFAQGNGEVALTAFEAPLRATLRVSLESGESARRLAAILAHPYGETKDAYIAIGIGPTLDDSMQSALRHAIDLVVERTGLSETITLSYLSAAADFEISQAVNGVRGVHCIIRKDDLEHARSF
jgi:acetamidase/formamidase